MRRFQLLMASACAASRAFSVAGISVCRRAEVAAHEVEDAQLLRQQAGGDVRRGPGRQRAAEQAVEDGERLESPG